MRKLDEVGTEAISVRSIGTVESMATGAFCVEDRSMRPLHRLCRLLCSSRCFRSSHPSVQRQGRPRRTMGLGMTGDLEQWQRACAATRGVVVLRSMSPTAVVTICKHHLRLCH
jgi:hypothetical protein